jgi:hypothetical protein
VTFDAVIRILLAAYLGLWTPAWCCCALKSGFGTLAGRTADARRAPSCCAARSHAVAPPPAKSCCDRVDAKDGEDAPASRCRCHETDTHGRLRLDTSAKAPLLFAALVYAAAAPVAIVVAAPVGQPAPTPASIERPPPRTLLAQHCLLVV